jgi:hypothetical protein
MAESRVSMLNERLAATKDINARLSPMFRMPTAVLWNRLEPRPRSPDLTRPLRAEVRDPLWMLCRQWQLGEYDGADAGMPVRAKLAAEETAVQSVTLRGGPARPYDPGTPLESLIERQPLEPDLMMSLYAGNRWLQRLAVDLGVDNEVVAAFRSAYAYAAPSVGGKDVETLKLATHRAELDLRVGIAGKGLDGGRVLAEIAAALGAGRTPSDAFVERGIAISTTLRGAVDTAAKAFKTDWYDRLFAAPGAGDDAWDPEHLEYNFALGAANADGTQSTLVADEYAGGRLDWHAFDVSGRTTAEEAGAQPERKVRSFVPTPIRFQGMPNVRWWEFEDRRVGFGLSTAAKTDLVKLLLAQFALVYSNDWFILPYAAKAGTLVDVQGIVVTDNFGFNTLVEPTAKRQVDLALVGRWTMWTLEQRGKSRMLDPRFFLAPALARSLESKPLDEVVFLRDEMANLVWAVESIIPDPLGGGRDARAAGRLLREAIARAYPEPVLEMLAPDVLLRYQLMGSVPENWIPLVSVKLQGQATSTVFLQGAMPRVPPLDPVANDAYSLLASKAVMPRGTILAHNPMANPNLVNEEEILRGGALVKRHIQQARWLGGATSIWCSRRKDNGRGEGSSGLTFDEVRLEKPNNE